MEIGPHHIMAFMVCGVTFLVLGMLVSTNLYYYDVSQLPKADGIVTDYRSEKVIVNEGSVSAIVIVEFDLNGEQIVAEARLASRTGFYNHSMVVHYLEEHYPIGSNITIHYLENNPDYAYILNSNQDSQPLIGVLMVVLYLIGVVGTLVFLKLSKLHYLFIPIFGFGLKKHSNPIVIDSIENLSVLHDDSKLAIHNQVSRFDTFSPMNQNILERLYAKTDPVGIFLIYFILGIPFALVFMGEIFYEWLVVLTSSNFLASKSMYEFIFYFYIADAAFFLIFLLIFYVHSFFKDKNIHEIFMLILFSPLFVVFVGGFLVMMLVGIVIPMAMMSILEIIFIFTIPPYLILHGIFSIFGINYPTLIFSICYFASYVIFYYFGLQYSHVNRISKSIRQITSDEERYLFWEGREVVDIVAKAGHTLVAYRSGNVYLWSKTPSREEKFLDLAAGIVDLDMYDDRVVAIASDGTFVVKTLVSETHNFVTNSRCRDIVCIKISEDWIAIGDQSGLLEIYQNDVIPQLFQSFPINDFIVNIWIREDRIILPCFSGRVYECVLEDGEFELKKTNLHLGRLNCSYLYGDLLYLGLESGNIFVYDLQTLAQRELKSSPIAVRSLVVNDEYIIAGMFDGSITVWSRRFDNKYARELSPHLLSVDTLALDKECLISGSIDSVVKEITLASIRETEMQLDDKEGLGSSLSHIWYRSEFIAEIVKCSICKQIIDLDEKDITSCKNCNSCYHKEELSIWLKRQNSCPICKYHQ